MWRSEPSRRTLAVLALAGAAALLAFAAFADPFAADSWLPPCPFHALTGWYCPGCGSTRALHALLHGQLALAMAMNPLTVFALPALPLLAMAPARIARPRLRRAHAWLGDARGWAVAVIAFGVLRNLPLMPFAWLAPG